MVSYMGGAAGVLPEPARHASYVITLGDIWVTFSKLLAHDALVAVRTYKYKLPKINIDFEISVATPPPPPYSTNIRDERW